MHLGSLKSYLRTLSIPLINIRIRTMALTRFEYVRSFETEDKLEPFQWIVLRVHCLDHKHFLQSHAVLKNPENKLRDLMLASARCIMWEIKEVTLGYGYSNVFNFVLQKNTTLYKRRASKLLSNITSHFTSCFVSEWSNYTCDGSITKVPVFEGFVYLLPQDQCLQDFLRIEQKCCHEINLKETTLRNLVDIAKMDYSETVDKVTNSSESEMNEMLFSLCNINYNNEPPKAKKGTILLQKAILGNKYEFVSQSPRKELREIHKDFHKEQFWDTEFPLEERTKISKFIHQNVFQRKNHILPHTWLVVRIDGKGFQKFSELHNFAKPNDKRSLALMSSAAKIVVKHFPVIILSYGQSDEYSFVIKRYGHKEKEGYSLISRIVSVFTAAFVHLWDKHFTDEKLSNPVFDARLVLYPTNSSLRDYLSWRQADCHINNMYNTCFWKLVIEKGLSRRDAQEYLKGTYSKDKLAILKDEFEVDYSEEDSLFRKGTVIVAKDLREATQFTVEHVDIIQDKFWMEKPWLLGKEFQAKQGIDNKICTENT